MSSKNKRWFAIVALAAVVAAPGTASAGKGATFASLSNAIASGNPDSIVAEVERAEKLPCGSCIDLVKPLIDADDARVRDVAAWWLAKRAIRDQVRDEMFARLQGGDTIAARNAAEVLGRFMHPDALMALEIAIHDGSLGDEARAAAATAVGTIGDYRGKAVLEGALTSESPAVRAAAARALREIRGNVDAVAVVDLLTDDDHEVVRQAVLTTGALRESAAVGPLLDVLRDTSRPEGVRKHAAWALGRIGDGSAREGLRASAENDPSMLVRGAARAASNALL